MREFFRGWRRKLGCITLVMALVFAGAWIRSFVIEDYFPLPFDIETGHWSLVGLGAENQSLVLYGDNLKPEPLSESDSTESLLTSAESTIPQIEPAPQEDEPADALVAISRSESTDDEWEQIGGPVSVRSHQVTISCIFGFPEPLVIIPFSWIVIPLTLLSAWLIVWKQQAIAATEQHAEAPHA